MKKKNQTFLHALKLWLIWNVVADISLVIFIVGGFLGYFIVGIVGFSLCSILPCESTYGGLAITLIDLALPCLVVGVLQWIALRDKIKPSSGWIFATALGWFVVGITFYYDLIYSNDFLSLQSALYYDPPYGTPIEEILLAGAIVGVVIGLPQWLVLRGKVSEGGWWLLWSVLGWVCTVTAFHVLSESRMGNGALVGLFPMGMITGVAYAYLFTQPSQNRLSYSG